MTADAIGHLRQEILADAEFCDRCGGRWSNCGETCQTTCPENVHETCPGFRHYNTRLARVIALCRADPKVRMLLS